MENSQAFQNGRIKAEQEINNKIKLQNNKNETVWQKGDFKINKITFYPGGDVKFALYEKGQQRGIGYVKSLEDAKKELKDYLKLNRDWEKDSWGTFSKMMGL